mgnify:CR=1 FL=1
MTTPRLLGDLLLDYAANPTPDNGGNLLRQIPCIQEQLIKQGRLSLDDLTDEQIDTLMKYTANQQKEDEDGNTL